MNTKSTLCAPDISCAHCAMTIKRELASIDGIISVEVNVGGKMVLLEHTNDEALARARARLSEIGYPATDA